MFSKKIFLLLFYVGIILNLLPFIYSLENKEKIDYIDLENEEQMKKIYMKILHYKSIEREPILHITQYSLEEEKSKHLRNLDESNIFEDITLVDA